MLGLLAPRGRVVVTETEDFQLGVLLHLFLDVLAYVGTPAPARPAILQNVARFRLYRHRFLQENMRFAAFFKIYQIITLKLKFGKILQILRHLQNFC